MDREMKTGLIVFLCILAGIMMAAIEYELNTQGILVNEFVTGTIAITDLMAVTIIVWILVGGIVAVIRQ